MSRYALIIVNWNSWDLLSICLEKLRAQTFQDFSVLVIDNASEELAPPGLFDSCSNVTLVRNRSNVGFAAANNQAFALLRDTEWVVLLNPDAFPEPNWMQRLIEAAEENPGFSMFASRQLMEGDRQLLDGDGDAYHISGLVWREGHGCKQSETTHKSQEVFSPCAAAGLYRRDAFISAGGFDEDFFCYVEDVELGFRMRLMGHRCLLVPGAVVYHMGSATSGGQQSDFAVYHGHRNLVWMYVKNMPDWLFWACLPLHLAMNLATVGVFILRGQGRVILGAKYDALLGLPKMWRKRQQIQKRRLVSVGEIWRVMDKRLLPKMRHG